MSVPEVKFHGYGYGVCGDRVLYITIDGRQALAEGPRPSDADSASVSAAADVHIGMTKRDAAKLDKAATEKLVAYAQAYEANRPFGASAKPNLCTNFLQGDGCSVYNHDERSAFTRTIATFSSPEAARKAARQFGY